MQTNCKKIFLWISIVLTTIGAIGWLVNTWYYSDDYCYSREALENVNFWECSGKPISSWEQVMPSIVNHYIYVNGRLSNAVLFPLQMFPRWVGMGIAGVLIGVLLWLLYRVGRLDRSRISLRWIALGPALLWLALPWFDSFQSMAYHYNYVPASICMLTVMYLMRDAASLSRKRLCIAVIAGALTGLLHEGFAGTLGVALCVMWLMERGIARRRIVYVMVTLVAGLIVSAIPEAFPRLLYSVNTANELHIPKVLTRLIRQLSPFWIAVVLWIVYALKYRGTPQLRHFHRITIPLFVGALADIVVAILSNMQGRALYPCLVCSTVLIMIIASEWIGSTSPRRGAVIVMSVATVLYALWLGSVVYWECRVGEMQRNFAERASQPGVAGSGVLYTDMDTMTVPFWTIELVTNKEYQQFLFSSVLTRCFDASPDKEKEPTALFVPLSCQGKPFEQWDTIPGTAHMRGKYPYVAVDSIDARCTKGFADEYLCNVTIVMGEPTIECSLIERVAYWLKRQLGIDVDHIDAICTVYPITVDGVQRGRVFFDALPIGLNNRQVLRIDTCIDNN